MLSGYSCFCQDAPMACRLGLAARSGCVGRGFACPGALAGGLAAANGDDPPTGQRLWTVVLPFAAGRGWQESPP